MGRPPGASSASWPAAARGASLAGGSSSVPVLLGRRPWSYFSLGGVTARSRAGSASASIELNGTATTPRAVVPEAPGALPQQLGPLLYVRALSSTWGVTANGRDYPALDNHSSLLPGISTTK